MQAGSKTSSPEQRPSPATQGGNGEPDDETLAAKAAAGNGPAFEELVRRYQDRLYTLLVQLCGSKTEAEDLAQETFLKAYRALRNFKQKSKFYTWLFRIAVNASISRGRKVSRLKRHEGISLDAAGDEGKTLSSEVPADGDCDPVNRLENREVQERVREGLERLVPEYRSVVLLRDMEGLDYEAIAETLGISSGAVKARLHRARMQLAKMLKGLRPDGHDGQV